MDERNASGHAGVEPRRGGGEDRAARAARTRVAPPEEHNQSGEHERQAPCGHKLKIRQRRETLGFIGVLNGADLPIDDVAANSRLGDLPLEALVFEHMALPLHIGDGRGCADLEALQFRSRFKHRLLGGVPLRLQARNFPRQVLHTLKVVALGFVDFQPAEEHAEANQTDAKQVVAIGSRRGGRDGRGLATALSPKSQHSQHGEDDGFGKTEEELRATRCGIGPRQARGQRQEEHQQLNHQRHAQQGKAQSCQMRAGSGPRGRSCRTPPHHPRDEEGGDNKSQRQRKGDEDDWQHRARRFSG